MSRMSFKDAMELVDDDLPDGAYWAMAHEIAGLEYGDGFTELLDYDGIITETERRLAVHDRTIHCPFGCGKKFRNETARDQHVRDKHAKRLAKDRGAA